MKIHPVLNGSPYASYVYAYPHKTAYRSFDPPKPLREVWAGEAQSALSLYVHVPFCAMRCGFCNLFTQAKPSESLPELYLDALERQAEAVRGELPDAKFARLAVGGGTPSYLSEPQLARLFGILRQHFDADPKAIPTGVEVSPDTLTLGKAALFKDLGVERVSIGVQSFDEKEAADSGRPQSRASLEAAFAILKRAKFPVLNIDLIYGLPGQTVQSWVRSLTEALTHQPQELYLYPLYVRPLTGLAKTSKTWDEVRMNCYHAARKRLRAEGYEQVSMRYFRRGVPADNSAYCLQDDGMVGLGCGARSYTRALHYSLDYAVAPKGVKAIIADYVAQGREEFAHAVHGYELDPDEQRRRYLLYALFTHGGLSVPHYRERFGTAPDADFPDLAAFDKLGLLKHKGDTIALTTTGLERSDALGPWFFSAAVRGRMAGYELR